ncbi:MAG: oxidoreductase [Candidatus Bathyarchaeia archaeon]|nr:oxidoreductase [Candidatus Bathyarchaeota archaeon]
MSKTSKVTYGLLIDYEYCTGCHTCEVACKQENNLPVGEWGIKVFEVIQQLPSKKLYITYIPFPTELCNLCVERVKSGKLPACVKHCMANCMSFGPVDKLAEKLKEKPRQVLWAPK